MMQAFQKGFEVGLGDFLNFAVLETLFQHGLASLSNSFPKHCYLEVIEELRTLWK